MVIKSNFKIIGILLLIFLVGCKATSDVDTSEFDACENLEDETVIVDCQYNTALDIGYVEYCYDLPEVGDKNIDECITLIAQNKNIPKLCRYIKDDVRKSVCYVRTAEKNENITICNSVKLEKQRVNCIFNFAIRNNQYAYCDFFFNDTKNIANIGFNRDMCVYNLITVNGNKTLCKEINSLQIKQEKLCR